MNTIQHEDYFSTLNERSAYVLGLYYSDGWVNKNNTVSISQCVENMEIINFIYNELEFKGAYYLGTRKIGNVVKYYPTLSFSNKRISKDLKKHGIIPNKTGTIVLPKLEKELMRFLLLGIFDGDGCIHYSQGKHTVFNIAGTKDSILSIYNYFLSEGITVRYTFVKGQTWIVYCYKKEEISKIYKLFYDNHSLGVIRKKETFESILNDYDLLESPETRFEFDYTSNKHEFNSYLIGCILGNGNFISKTRLIINKGSVDVLQFIEKLFDKYMTPTAKNIINNTLYKLTFRSDKLFKYLEAEMSNTISQSIVNRINKHSLGILFLMKGFTDNGLVTIKNVKYSKHDNERISAFVRKRLGISFIYNDVDKQWNFDKKNSLLFMELIKDMLSLHSNHKTNERVGLPV